MLTAVRTTRLRVGTPTPETSASAVTQVAIAAVISSALGLIEEPMNITEGVTARARPTTTGPPRRRPRSTMAEAAVASSAADNTTLTRRIARSERAGPARRLGHPTIA